MFYRFAFFRLAAQPGSGIHSDPVMSEELDKLIDLANQRSSITGQNAAEELMQILLQTGMAEIEVPSDESRVPRLGTQDSAKEEHGDG